jgi:hypothetical protein
MVKPETIQIAVVAAIVCVAVAGGWFIVSGVRANDGLQDRHLLSRGKELPVLWIYVNDSDVNSRQWTAFAERSSRVLNIPFLNLCYQSCVKANGQDYRIEVIGGLTDLASRLGGWEALPTPLRNPVALVREPELNWIRAAVMAKWGGLWVSPATIWLKPMGKLPADRLSFFGSDDEVTFVGDGGTPAPSLRVVWSPMPRHPVWVHWEEKVRARLEKRAGGAEFRRDQMSDAVDAIQEAQSRGEKVDILPTTELTRKGAAGRRIQIEDLLASGQGTDMPFTVTTDTAYVPVPWPELEERRAFGWFLRMSEDQIMESDLAIRWLFQMAI